MRFQLIPCLMLVFVLVLPACGAPLAPTATPIVEGPTATLTATPTATSTVIPPTPTPAVEPTASLSVTAPPSAMAPPSVTALPTATAPAGGQPPAWMALYGAGSEEGARLYALAVDGSATDLELDVYRGAAVSGSGRWLASPSSFPFAGSVVITDLQGEATYTIPAIEGWGIYGSAFDLDETLLAFLELAPAQVKDIPWAIVVVRLADGSTTRFEGTTRGQEGMYPGNPLGWTSAGHELLLGTFLPYSDGLYAGVWAVGIPLDAPSAPFDTLTRRELVPGGSYWSTPHLSPDGTRLVYLNRSAGYTPADYDPALDADTPYGAVNQLWSVDVESAVPALLYEVTNGDALGHDAAWAPDSTQVLLAQGHYAGMDWGSLALRVRDEAGGTTEVAPLPLPDEEVLLRLNWCRPQAALAGLSTGRGTDQLYRVQVAEGKVTPVAAGGTIFVVGCVAGGIR